MGKVYERQQKQTLQGIAEANQEVILTGDGRADSPGHSAKYGSYTVIELNVNKVIDFQLVQVSTCSYNL